MHKESIEKSVLQILRRVYLKKKQANRRKEDVQLEHCLGQTKHNKSHKQKGHHWKVREEFKFKRQVKID